MVGGRGSPEYIVGRWAHWALVHRRVLVLTPVLALLLAACGIDEDVVAREAAEVAPPSTSTTAPSAPDPEPGPDGATPASPFTVEEIPSGYELLVEGAGEAEADDEVVPVTVLGPEGEPTGPEVVFVEAVASGDDGFDDTSGWDALTEDGIRVWAIDAEEDDLEDLRESVTEPEPGSAPVVEDPPDGLEVAGRITADGVLALRATLPAADDGPVPGPTSGHTSVWTADGATLVVMTVPAGAFDPAVVVTEVREPRRVVEEERDAVAEEVEVGDATGVVTTTADAATGAVVRRELAVETAWGDVLLVVSRGAELLDADDLVAVAESVEQA